MICENNIRTKHALGRALFRRLGRAPLAKITVKQLAEDCGIKCQTFYYHFADIYDLFRWMLKVTLDQVLFPSAASQADLDLHLKQPLLHAQKHRKLFLNMVNDPERTEFERCLYQMVLPSILEQMHKNGIGGSESYQKFVAHSVVSSLTGTLYSWLTGELDLTVDEFCQCTQGFINRICESAKPDEAEYAQEACN